MEDQVRSTFTATWDEFYQVKPPLNNPLSDKSLTSDEHRNLQLLKARDHQYALAGGSDRVVSSFAGSSKAKASVKPCRTHRRILQGDLDRPQRPLEACVTPSSKTLIIDVRPLPRYHFCHWVNENVVRKTAEVMSFLPSLNESRARQYVEEHCGRLAQLGPGRDPDIDIILVETLRRLTAQQITYAAIDETRLLPVEAEAIRDLDLDRDLPAFPEQMRRGFESGEIHTRSWKGPLLDETVDDPGDESNWSNAEHYNCRHPMCLSFFCVTHAQSEYRCTTPTWDQAPQAQSLTPACSDRCYKVSPTLQRTYTRTPWPKHERDVLITLLSAQVNTGSTSCDLRHFFRQKDCNDIHHEISSLSLPRSFEAQTRRSKSSLSLRTDPNTIPHGLFCSHGGPCTEDCPCTKADSTCEVTCSCDSNCVRRFRGCTCNTRPSSQISACQPGSCECISAARECDLDLCGSCGARQAVSGLTLDSCGNVMLQRHKQAAVRVGISAVAGYGLFAAANIECGQMILEYVGESIQHWELERRSQIYEETGRNYAFQLNHYNNLDAANLGNESRYINGVIPGTENCRATVLRVHGDHRIMIRATRDITQHEELSLNYGESFRLGLATASSARVTADAFTKRSHKRRRRG